jgi:hypothetical protein
MGSFLPAGGELGINEAAITGLPMNCPKLSKFGISVAKAT